MGQQILFTDINAGNTQYSAFYTIYNTRVHELYNPNTNENDIALIYTNNRIVYSAAVAPICLPPRQYVWDIDPDSISFSKSIHLNTFSSVFPWNNNRPPDGSNVLVAGWGSTEFGGPKATTLQVTSVAVYNSRNCQNALGSTAVLGAGQFCAFTQGKDSCQVRIWLNIFWIDNWENVRLLLISVWFGISGFLSQHYHRSLDSRWRC